MSHCSRFESYQCLDPKIIETHSVLGCSRWLRAIILDTLEVQVLWSHSSNRAVAAIVMYTSNIAPHDIGAYSDSNAHSRSPSHSH